ncbi:MAG: HD domain-containing protein, partial [Actinobacteria bacterium]|nr:HD domain-containing protein [Actinomycetota bacterium]
SEREAAYYVALLSSVGCTADASELAAWFGDDNAFRSATYGVDLAGLPLFGFMLRRAGTGGSPWHRVRITAALVAEGNRSAAESMASHCDVAATLAERLGLGPSLYEPMRQLFARWDGKGEPRLRGEEIALSVRLVQLADIVEAHRSAGGPRAALVVARKRAGTQFDPMLVAQLERHADDVFAGLDGETTWDEVVAAEPTRSSPIAEHELDEAFAVVADFADLKSPYFRGHSRGVAALAADAAGLLGLSASETVAVRRAALLHDLGRTGVPNTVWDKPGALSESERERVRLHPYYTERALARPAALARLGAIAGAHHERVDGSGYHRGLTGASLSPSARVLAAADAYHAMTEPRPHRPQLGPADAADELRRDVRAGRFDGDVAEAVLAAAGHRTGSRRRSAPGGLTPRELEVLVLLARGASTREIAKMLVIAEKTAANHVEHIYAKIDVSTRAAAALYAMRHGLLETLEPLSR